MILILLQRYSCKFRALQHRPHLSAKSFAREVPFVILILPWSAACKDPPTDIGVATIRENIAFLVPIYLCRITRMHPQSPILVLKSPILAVFRLKGFPGEGLLISLELKPSGFKVHGFEGLGFRA